MLSRPLISRRSFFIPAAIVTTVSAGILHHAATAAPVKNAAQKPVTLSFRMTARYSYKESAEDRAAAQQTINAQVHLRGNNARIESTVGGRPLVVLYAPPYAYRLLPSSKTGIRYRLGATPRSGGLPANLSPQALLSNPTAIRAALQKQGAKRAGTAQLNGQATDIYTVKNFRGQGQNVKAWLRRSDALPLRMEMTSSRLNAVASWSNYQRGHNLAASLFSVPSGYRVRDAAQS